MLQLRADTKEKNHGSEPTFRHFKAFLYQTVQIVEIAKLQSTLRIHLHRTRNVVTNDRMSWDNAHCTSENSVPESC